MGPIPKAVTSDKGPDTVDDSVGGPGTVPEILDVNAGSRLNGALERGLGGQSKEHADQVLDILVHVDHHPEIVFVGFTKQAAIRALENGGVGQELLKEKGGRLVAVQDGLDKQAEVADGQVDIIATLQSASGV